MCLSECGYVHMIAVTLEARRGQEETLELELEVAVSQYWDLGTQSRSSTSTASPLNCCAISSGFSLLPLAVLSEAPTVCQRSLGDRLPEDS